MVHVMMFLLFSQPRPVEPKPVDVKPAMTPEVKALVDRVQAFYEKTNDFTAEFKQDYTYQAFKRTQSSSGKVTYARPAQMRWDYQQPSPRTFVLSKDRVTMLDPEAMTLTTSSIATSQLSASVTFLWGQGKLADEFSIAKKDCKDCKGTLLELTPLKPDPRFQKVLLEVDPKSATVLKSTVIDPDGSQNAITFGPMQLNTGVDPSKFKLVPPPGTQVIDYTRLKPVAPAP
ncbi:MAG: outer membrane protein LolA [Myxococcaceae bacterium]|nr:outer membrane protein LolA [Myxococcaceae bacterium]